MREDSEISYYTERLLSILGVADEADAFAQVDRPFFFQKRLSISVILQKLDMSFGIVATDSSYDVPRILALSLESDLTRGANCLLWIYLIDRS